MSSSSSTATTSTGDPYDPSSKQYKKARRQHHKTTKNRAKDVDADWTPFRAKEKKYKARFPPPDLSDVLDLATLDPTRVEEIANGGWKGRPDAVEHREIQMKGHDRGRHARKAYAVPRIPGLVLLPSFVSPETQRDLVRWSLRDHARHPNATNLDTHYILPDRGLWNSLIYTRENNLEEEIVYPRASAPSPPSPSSASSSASSIPELPGPRQLISNTPASPSTFPLLSSTLKLPSSPSASVHPLPTSAIVPKLRWANIGWFYHWGTKQYDFTKGKQPVSDAYRSVCKDVVESVHWDEVFRREDVEGWGEEGPDWHTWRDSYEPDAGIVNFYQTRDTLMAHVDRSEVCATSPLVSISLGNAAVFLIGGLTRDVEPVPILLRSGDVVIMSGPACRRAYHGTLLSQPARQTVPNGLQGVPRILENTLPENLRTLPADDDSGVENRGVAVVERDREWAPYAEYMRTARINVNVRQVFPKGFNPGLDVPVPRC